MSRNEYWTLSNERAVDILVEQFYSIVRENATNHVNIVDNNTANIRDCILKSGIEIKTAEDIRKVFIGVRLVQVMLEHYDIDLKECGHALMSNYLQTNLAVMVKEKEKDEQLFKRQ